MIRFTRTDEDIKKDIVDELYWDERIDASRVRVEVDGGTAELSGSVPSYAVRRVAEAAARRIRGVGVVTNCLAVRLPRGARRIDDTEIERRIGATLAGHPDMETTRMAATAKMGIVKLEGAVSRYWDKVEMEAVASKIGGVIAVDNRLAVVLTKAARDEAVAEAILTSIDRSTDLDARAMTVEVADGCVTLSGTLSDGDARRRAEALASGTEGVREVVNNLAIEYGHREIR